MDSTAATRRHAAAGPFRNGAPGASAYRWAVLGAALLLVIALLASLAFGAGSVTPERALPVLVGAGDEEASFTVRELRLPRTAVAVVVGLALGIAGAVLQATTRNMLAEPELLGISGASSFVVALSVAWGFTASTVPVVWAILGAFAGCGLALAVARLRGVGDDPVRLVLAGAALAMVLRAGTSTLLMIDQRTADEVRVWIVGAVAGKDFGDLPEVMPFLAAGLVLCVLLSKPLSALALGDQVATALGHKPRRVRIMAMLAVGLLVGVATALAGPLSFVGLVVPFAARALAGPSLGRVLLLSALLGPCLLLFADVASRLVVRPSEMPLGIVTSIIGAPVLVFIVRTRRLPTL